MGRGSWVSGAVTRPTTAARRLDHRRVAHALQARSPMPWIPHLMVLDDDPRVLDSLVPSFAHDLARALVKRPAVVELLRRGEAPGHGVSTAPVNVKITAHGYASDRLTSYRHR